MRILPCLSVLALTATLCAQEVTAPPAASPNAAPAAPVFREQSIYIPYDKLWKVFEKEGRGVFVPYEEFNRLWTAARSNLNARAEAPAPMASILKEVAGVLTVGKEVVEATATLRLELLKDGWHEIPLGLSDVGVTRAEVGGQPARLVSAPGKGLALLVEKKASDPAEAELKLTFARAYEKNPGSNRLAFQPPPAAVSRWEIVIPEPGVKAVVDPLLAASESPGVSTNETRLVAVVGAAPRMTVTWTPKSEGAVGLEALVNVTTHLEVEIDEGVTRTRATLRYGVSRAKLPRLEFEVPADQKVVGVTDANVKEWKLLATGGVQVVKVELFEPASGAQPVVVELEKHGNDAKASVTPVRARGVARQQGTVSVRVSPRLRAEVATRPGFTQIDEKEVPAGGALPLLAAFRHSAAEATLTLAVEAVKPLIRVESVNRVQINPDQILQEARFLFRIEKAGVFKLQVRLPAGFELTSVSGQSLGQQQAPRVESHFVENDVLTVNLAAQALGDACIRLNLLRRLNEPALLQPNAGEVALEIGLPRAHEDGVESQKGVVEWAEHAALQRLKVDNTGLEYKGAQEAASEVGWTQPLAGRGVPTGYFFHSHEPARVSISLKRRAPYVAAGQLMEVSLESGRAQFRDTFHYQVSYSGVRQLRIDVPQALAGSIKLVYANVRMRPATDAESAAPSVPIGYKRLVLEDDNEFLNKVAVVLEWNEKIAELQVGKSVDVVLPRLLPAGVDHAWGQIALKKAEAIEVLPGEARAGLRPIDPERDLMENRKLDGVAQAYEFRGEWNLSLKATRYEVADVKTTSIERGWVRQVLTRGGLTSVQALYRLRSARQRLAITLPEGAGFDTQPARINGSPVPLEKGQAGEYFVPLTGRSPDESFVLELRYTVKDQGRTLASPSFPGEPAVQKVYQSAYLPANQRYLGSGGPWSDENIWVLHSVRVGRRANRSADSLMNWVTEGVTVDAGALRQFATDGTHLLFSGLRPETGPDGALRVRALTGWAWDLALVALVLAVGTPLVRKGFRPVLTAVTAIACVWVLALVFWPDLIGSTLSEGTIGAVFVLGVLWFTRQILSGDWRKNLPLRRALPVAPPAAPLPAPAPAPAPVAPPAPPSAPPSAPEGKE